MLSIVIPCYNEAENIPLLLECFKQVVDVNPDTEIIFVNNGSVDNSKEVFENKIALYPSLPFRVVTIEKNHGYGHGIMYGLRCAQGDLLSWTHADMQTDPLDLLKGAELYKEIAHPLLLVKGKRKNRKWLDVFFTWGMELFASVALKTRLYDINAQPKIFSRFFFEQIQSNAPTDFSLDLYFLYFAAKYGRVLEFSVFFPDRRYGEAKGGGSLKGKYKLVRRTISYIFFLRKTLL